MHVYISSKRNKEIHSLNTHWLTVMQYIHISIQLLISSYTNQIKNPKITNLKVVLMTHLFLALCKMKTCMMITEKDEWSTILCPWSNQTADSQSTIINHKNMHHKLCRSNGIQYVVVITCFESACCNVYHFISIDEMQLFFLHLSLTPSGSENFAYALEVWRWLGCNFLRIDVHKQAKEVWHPGENSNSNRDTPVPEVGVAL